MRNRVSLEQRSLYLKEKTGAARYPTSECISERYYPVREVAGMLNLSDDKVRRMFQDEQGVLVIGDQPGASGDTQH